MGDDSAQQGNEFVTMRLLKLASIITARTAEKVHSGLLD